MPQAGINDERDFITGDPGDEQNDSKTVGTGEGVSSNERNSENPGSRSSDQGEENFGSQAQTIVTDDEKEADVASALVEAHRRRLVAFNLYAIKKFAPKTLAALIEYMIKVSDFQGIDEDTATGILFYSPGAVLSNFFDDNEIYVTVGGSGSSWHYSINGNPAVLNIANRSAAIVEGTLEAFKTLEQKLNSNK